MLAFVGAAFALQVVEFNGGHHVLGQSQVAAHHVAFKAGSTKFTVFTTRGADIGGCALVIVLAVQAPRTRFGSFSTFEACG